MSFVTKPSLAYAMNEKARITTTPMDQETFRLQKMRASVKFYRPYGVMMQKRVALFNPLGKEMDRIATSNLIRIW